MKNTSKILALVLVVMTLLMSLSAITASAASSRVVNISDLAAGKTTDAELITGTGIYAFAGMSIESNSKTVDEVTYTMRLKLPGTMKVDANYIKFDTEGPAKITVIAISGNGSEVRPLKVSKLVDGALVDVQSHDVPGDAAGKYEYSVSEAGTYYLGSGKSGINLYYIEVEDIEVCEHTGGTATCKDQAVCSKCEQPYGELTEDHNFADGACTVCGTPDPNACAHENMAPATCTAPKTCECGYTEGEALGHDIIVDEAVAPTCTEKGLEAGEHCSRCDHKVEQKEIAALGHTLTFVNTLPTAEAAGKTIADCSVCNEHFDFGEVNVMTPGTYVLDAAALAGIAQYSLFDGEVKVVDGVFACHLSYKYRTDENVKTFAADDWTSTHRMNFGGKSAFCNNGEGEEAVRNGGLMNFVQIVTTNTTTITIHWNAGGAGREVAVYDMNGEILFQSNDAPEDNKYTAVTTFTVPAGSYLLGNVVNQNYWHKVTVEVECPHNWSDATCTEPAKCECGETQGEALGHDYKDGACTRCEAADPDYIPHEHEFVEGKCECGETDPDWVAPAPEMNFFQKIIAMIMDLINKLLAMFKK